MSAIHVFIPLLEYTQPHHPDHDQHDPEKSRNMRIAVLILHVFLALYFFVVSIGSLVNVKLEKTDDSEF